VKIGVIADTHIPDLLPSLPPRVEEVLQGLDIILHLGDICTVETLHQLESKLTITMAVAGEEDEEETKGYLEEKKVVRFGQSSIGMIHGHQEEMDSGWGAWMSRLLFGFSQEELCKYVLDQFEDVDCVVFGHSHRPYVKMWGRVLLFNPGAVAPSGGLRPTVGILNVSGKMISGRIVYL
jgi:putative phosphoesterase